MKVLIVDDNPLELQTLKEILIDSEVQTEVSINMDTVTNFAPDLIILDLYMPHQSGHDICLNIKSNPDICNIPVIILSGSSDISDKVRCFKAGALDYIEKPITRESLMSAVKKYARIGEIYRAGENITSTKKRSV
jgi:DNA-binding response OmpR family regulator